MKFHLPILFTLGYLYICTSALFSQKAAPSLQDLQARYEDFREEAIGEKRFGIEDLIPLFERHQSRQKIQFDVRGYSLENRPIYLAQYGHGDIRVLLWSQMHGDESTATMALLDLFNYLESTEADDLKFLEGLQSRLSIYFIPMLNPDGASKFQRNNAANIDLNRDAVHLSNPESRLLKSVRDSLEPVWGFNLHDQSIYNRAGQNGKQVALAFLAPAYDFGKNINGVRKRSMQLIAHLRDSLETIIPHRIAVYDDSFEPRAFGDNVMKWGTSSVLIESGGYPGDPEKQYLRELNFLTLIKAMESILTKSYLEKTVEEYQSIPENERRMMSLIIKDLKVPVARKHIRMDVGYLTSEQNRSGEIYQDATIVDVGDLSIFSGFQEFEAGNLEVKAGQWYPETFGYLQELSVIDWPELVKKGYLGFTIRAEPEGIDPGTSFLICKKPEDDDERLDLNIAPGNDPTFLLRSGITEQRWVVHNGGVYTLEDFILHLRQTILGNR